jgi:hypothetical protein
VASTRLVDGAIAQEREEDPGEPPGERDHGDTLAAPGGDATSTLSGSRSRSIETAAWMSSHRTRLEPALVIPPGAASPPNSAREEPAPGRPRPRARGGSARRRRSPRRTPPPSPARRSARSAGVAPARRSP